VTGYVLKRLSAEDTTQTHLDVILYDETGRVLRSTVENFAPRQIFRRYQQMAFAAYRIILDPLPLGTSRLLVRAHKGTHP
jgi:hypothetical protein